MRDWLTRRLIRWAMLLARLGWWLNESRYRELMVDECERYEAGR